MQKDDNFIMKMMAGEQKGMRRFNMNIHPDGLITVSLKKKPKGTWQSPELIVAPRAFQQHLLELYHDNKLSGHPGAQRMANELSKAWFWKGLETDCRAYAQVPLRQGTWARPPARKQRSNGCSRERTR